MREERRKEEEKRKNAEWAASLAQKTEQGNVLAEIEAARERAALEKDERAFIARREAERQKLIQQRQMFEQDAIEQTAARKEKQARQEVEEARHAALLQQAKREWELKMLEEREKFCINAEKLRIDYEK